MAYTLGVSSYLSSLWLFLMTCLCKWFVKSGFLVKLLNVALQKPEQAKVETEYVNAKEIELLFEIKQVRFSEVFV